MGDEDQEPPAPTVSGDGAADTPGPNELTVSTERPLTQPYSTVEEKMFSPTATEHRSVHSLDPVPESDGDGEGAPIPKADDKDDSASMYSTSSRSFFRPSSLRRKATDRSAASSTGVDKNGPQQRTRRASEAKSEEEVSSLGLTVEMEIQDQSRSGWGIGDEARMALE